jgi:glutathione S-transferase
MRTLVGLAYSPWTEKARWALDHHAIPYRFDDFLPMIGEPFLRVRTRRLGGRITVPVLLDERVELGDSFDIARYTDEIGTMAHLFPEGTLQTIRTWNDASERALAAGRSLVISRMAGSSAAQAESLPRFVPRAARDFLAPIAKTAIGFLARKHQSVELLARASETVASMLGDLRTALGGRPYLLDRFTYADITTAVVLQVVRPVGDEYIRLGRATRACWTSDELAAKFSDLLAWRDELYARHRARHEQRKTA